MKVKAARRMAPCWMRLRGFHRDDGDDLFIYLYIFIYIYGFIGVIYIIYIYIFLQ